MTPLKALILQLLKRYGPMNDLEIWVEMKDQETGGLGAEILVCCLELHEAGFIEPPHNDPHLWQLSEKGLQFVSENLRAEVDHG